MVFLGLDISAGREVDHTIVPNVEVIRIYDIAAGVDGGARADARGQDLDAVGVPLVFDEALGGAGRDDVDVRWGSRCRCARMDFG